MPVEILTAAQRAEWERFPKEIDERALARCFSFPDDEVEQIVSRRAAHPRFATSIYAFDQLVRVGERETAAEVNLFAQETRSVNRIGEPLERLQRLRQLGAEEWDLSAIPANRQRMLARYVRHATSQALTRRDPQFRHPALLAFCAESAVRLTDELVDLLDQGVGSQHAKARSALVALKLNVAERANSSVLLLAELLEVLLDDAIPDAGVRDAVWRRSTPEQLQQALELAEEIRRPEGDSHLDQLNDRYHAIREFTPRTLAALQLRAGPGGERLLAAVEVLRGLNARGARKVPETAPVDFVPRAWRPYVLPAGGGIDRRYWELCLLSELRGGLRAGQIWVAGSRRYQDPERSLIARDKWLHARDEVRGELELPASAGPRLDDLRDRAVGHREQLEKDLAAGDADVAVDQHGNLKVARLRAQPRDTAIDKLASEIANELQIVDLPDLLFDIDVATGFWQALDLRLSAGRRRPLRAV